MAIEWDKIEKKPKKSYKIQGIDLLDLRAKIVKQDDDILESSTNIESLKSDLSELKEKVSQKEKNISELQAEISHLQVQMSEKESEIASLNQQRAEETSKYDSEIQGYTSQLDELLAEIKAKESTIQEKDTKIEKLNGKIEDLNSKIEELKEQIPKKPVYEKAEEVARGAACPKCGWTTVEEYKIVDGRKQLIRKYCPNTFCLWTSAETPKVKIAMSKKAPGEEEHPIKIFKVVGAELEETSALDTSTVAVIADPDQNIVWIWKGKESDRFEYAEATSKAASIKNKYMLKGNAQIIRIDEDLEPENFPLTRNEAGNESEILPKSS